MRFPARERPRTSGSALFGVDARWRGGVFWWGRRPRAVGSRRSVDAEARARLRGAGALSSLSSASEATSDFMVQTESRGKIDAVRAACIAGAAASNNLVEGKDGETVRRPSAEPRRARAGEAGVRETAAKDARAHLA